LGVRFGLRVSQEGALEPLRRHLLGAGCQLLDDPLVDVLFSYRVGGPRGRGRHDFHLLYSAARQVIRTREPAEIRSALWQQLQLQGGAVARDYLVLSSALLEWKGRALLLLSPARAGRTSLLQALAQRGGRVWGDSLCPVDDQAQVHPCPQPDTTALDRPLPLAGILSTRYLPTARGPLRRLSPAQTCVELFKCCLGARQQPDQVLQRLSGLARRVPCWKGPRGGVEDGLAPILGGLERWFC
jgi:hypothetical protein